MGVGPVVQVCGKDETASTSPGLGPHGHTEEVAEALAL